MRLIFVSAMTLLLAAFYTLAIAQSFDAKVDGAFRITTVTSEEACSALCEGEDLCRGTIFYETVSKTGDHITSELECRLYDGLAPGSPYAVKRPELSLDVALKDLNAYRANYNLPPVALNSKLIAASKVHAEDMGAHGIIAHEGTDGSQSSDRAQRQGYYYHGIAENVAAGQKTWDAVFEAWQKSPGHNDNLLMESAEDFGVAIVYNPNTRFTTYWVMLMAAEIENFQHTDDAMTAKQKNLLQN